MPIINTVRDLVCAVREQKYTTRPGVSDFTSLGGYTAVFYTADGDMVKPTAVYTNLLQCARDIRDKAHDRIIACDVYWEGPDETCALSGETIESSYGDPDADSSDSDD